GRGHGLRQLHIVLVVLLFLPLLALALIVALRGLAGLFLFTLLLRLHLDLAVGEDFYLECLLVRGDEEGFVVIQRFFPVRHLDDFLDDLVGRLGVFLVEGLGHGLGQVLAIDLLLDQRDLAFRRQRHVNVLAVLLERDLVNGLLVLGCFFRCLLHFGLR